MKKRVTLLVTILVLGMLFWAACLGGPGKQNIEGQGADLFKTADLLRKDLWVIVTDETVRPLIPPETLERLADAEKIFLAAMAIHEKGVEGDAEPLVLLADSADEIICILDTLVLDGHYKEEVAAARLALKVLRNHIQLE